MTTFTYDGYLSTHDGMGDTTTIKEIDLEFVVAKKSSTLTYTRPDEGIDLISPIQELRIDGKAIAADEVIADIIQISWNSGVANILVVTLGEQRCTMQISGNALPAFNSAAEYQDFMDSIVSSKPLTWGFYGPGEKIPYDRIMTPHMTEKDRILGTEGNDIYNTGVGNDHVAGLGGNDVLKGGAGNDKLIGGVGADKLIGGQGEDTFIFKSIGDSTTKANGRDVIVDFSRGQHDRIDLKALDADETINGNQAFDFIGARSFSGEAGELRYQKKNGDTLVSVDVDGDRKADFSILLDGQLNLRASDFML